MCLPSSKFFLRLFQVHKYTEQVIAAAMIVRLEKNIIENGGNNTQHKTNQDKDDDDDDDSHKHNKQTLNAEKWKIIKTVACTW